VAILLIENEAKIGKFLRRSLRDEGYTVETAGDGQGGVELALAQGYDLIILDLPLPPRDDLEVCRKLRAEGIATPILMLSARDTMHDRLAGFNAGADDYVVKPFAVEELVVRARSLLRRERVPQIPALSIADLALDPMTRRVTRGNRTVDLTTREFQVLYLLLRHPGQVLSRATIEARVWGYGSGAESNVIDAYIRRLRRKIDLGHARKLIHTVRGAGYVLRAD